MSDKTDYQAALKKQREIYAFLNLPRCVNCIKFAITKNACAKFGAVPAGVEYRPHTTPCPHFDDIPF